MPSDKRWRALPTSSDSGLLGATYATWVTESLDVSMADKITLALTYRHGDAGAPATVLSIRPTYGDRAEDYFAPDFGADAVWTLDTSGLSHGDIIRRVVTLDVEGRSVLVLEAMADVVTDRPYLDARVILDRGLPTEARAAARPAIPSWADLDPTTYPDDPASEDDWGLYFGGPTVIPGGLDFSGGNVGAFRPTGIPGAYSGLVPFTVYLDITPTAGDLSGNATPWSARVAASFTHRIYGQFIGSEVRIGVQATSWSIADTIGAGITAGQRHRIAFEFASTTELTVYVDGIKHGPTTVAARDPGVLAEAWAGLFIGTGSYVNSVIHRLRFCAGPYDPLGFTGP